MGDDVNRDTGRLLVERLSKDDALRGYPLCPFQVYQDEVTRNAESTFSHQCDAICNPRREQRMEAYRARRQAESTDPAESEAAAAAGASASTTASLKAADDPAAEPCEGCGEHHEPGKYCCRHHGMNDDDDDDEPISFRDVCKDIFECPDCSRKVCNAHPYRPMPGAKPNLSKHKCCLSCACEFLRQCATCTAIGCYRCMLMKHDCEKGVKAALGGETEAKLASVKSWNNGSAETCVIVTFSVFASGFTPDVYEIPISKVMDNELKVLQNAAQVTTKTARNEFVDWWIVMTTQREDLHLDELNAVQASVPTDRIGAWSTYRAASVSAAGCAIAYNGPVIFIRVPYVN